MPGTYQAVRRKSKMGCPGCRISEGPTLFFMRGFVVVIAP